MLAVDQVTPFTQAVTFTVIAGVFTLFTLLVTHILKGHENERANRMAIAKEERDNARQDEVQRKADAATRATLARLRTVEDTTTITHALVNSDKTASMKARLDGARVNLALMREVLSLKKAQGHAPTDESLIAIADLEQQIQTLHTDIEERLSQQKAAEEAVANNKLLHPIGTPGTEADVLAQAVVAVTEAAKLPALPGIWPDPVLDLRRQG